MFLKKKNKVLELVDSVTEMSKILCELNTQDIFVSDCLLALESIHIQLGKEKNKPINSIQNLEKIKIILNEFLNNILLINKNSVEVLKYQLLELKKTIQEEVPTKLNIVFFPYKVSMWDSLATIYEAAAKDENCVAHVVPIPYYQLTQNESIPVYEGERFPESVPITHYSQYNLEDQDPDIIYVHNIYDDNNTITRVFDEYFTSNLKKYTDMLVYVPYFTPHFMFENNERIFLGYNTPSFKNVDKIILANNKAKDAAIQDGVPKDKILVLGSPKIDSMVRALDEETAYPKEWEKKIKGKTVYLLNTGCLYFANNPFLALEKLIEIFNIPRFVENSVIIWRPHPLTKVSIMKYTPYFSDYFLNLMERYSDDKNRVYEGVIIDETDDYIPALKKADVLISTNGSLLRSFLLTEKKVIYWAENKWEKSLLPNSALSSDIFYYAYDKSEPWYKLVKKFSKGYDPLFKNRNGIAAKAYVNTDGSSGKKIHDALMKNILNLA